MENQNESPLDEGKKENKAIDGEKPFKVTVSQKLLDKLPNTHYIDFNNGLIFISRQRTIELMEGFHADNSKEEAKEIYELKIQVDELKKQNDELVKMFNFKQDQCVASSLQSKEKDRQLFEFTENSLKALALRDKEIEELNSTIRDNKIVYLEHQDLLAIRLETIKQANSLLQEYKDRESKMVEALEKIMNRYKVPNTNQYRPIDDEILIISSNALGIKLTPIK